MHYIMFKTIKL